MAAVGQRLVIIVGLFLTSSVMAFAAPSITSLSPTSGPSGTWVTIAGSGFGATQSGSTVTLNAISATVIAWSDSAVVAVVPSSATSGPYSVTVSGQTAQSSSFTVNSGLLPSGWSDADVGSVGVAGSASYVNGTFTVAGGGAQIYGAADSFNFAYQQLAGDGTIVARVVSVQGGSGWVSAGVMIRETLDPGSANAKVSNWPTYSAIYLDDRTTTGGGTSEPGSANSTLPCWVKLVRSGNTFSSYASSDGVNWTQVGTSQTLSMASSVSVGLAVDSGNTSALATAVFDNVSTSSAAQPAPAILGLSATTGSIGSEVVISGSGFGTSEGGSVVTLGAIPVIVNSWSDASIDITIPAIATSGPLVVSVAPAMNDSNPALFTVTTQPLPSGWLDQDVGSVSTAGSATYADGAFVVSGAGVSIYGSTDEFHFVYQQLSGDGTIVARVVSVLGGSGWVTAGAMIRATLDTGSANVKVAEWPSYSAIYLDTRTTAGGNTTEPGSAGAALPYWVKLVRIGATFSSFVSSDGTNWTQAGASQTVSMPQNVYVGLAVNSGTASSLAVATFDNVSVVASGSQDSSPSITSLSPTTAVPNASVTIAGSNFGTTRGSSTVTFNGTVATTTSWSPTTIVVPVPTGAVTGNVVVSVGGVSSNGVAMTIVSPPSPSRPGGSTLDQTNPLATNLAGLFLMNEGTGSFDQDLVDGQEANFSGGSQPTWNTGDPSIVFSGGGSLNSFLDGGTDLTFDQLTTSQMTVVAKVYVGAVTPAGVCEKNDNNATDSGFVFGWDGSGALRLTVEKSSSNMRVSSAGGAILAGQWTQLAFTWDGTVGMGAVAHLFINGVEQTKSSSADGSGTLGYANATNQPFRIGNADFDFAGSLNGKMAYLAVYKGRILSTTELQSFDAQLPLGSQAATPSVTSLTPNAGPAGTSVTIAGAYFSPTQGSSTVAFNGTAATPTSWGPTSIVVPAPAGATTGNVVVTVGGVASNGVSFTVPPAPGITSLSPVSGPVGTAVTITGTNFGATQGSSTVTFTGTAATPTSWNASSIVVPVPAGATPGNVVVTVAGTASGGSAYSVTGGPTVGGMSPNSGAVGTSVLITGTNFGATQGASTVTLNGVTATATTWSATSLVFAVPAGATSGVFTVTVNSQTAGSPSFTVTTATLPSGWIDADVGVVGTAGSASYSNGTFTLSGAGNQISGTADAFHFSYQPLPGDGSIVARIASLPTGALAGVMIRETLDPGSTNGKTTDYAPYGAVVDFDVRTTPGASTSEPGTLSPATPPYWVKLVRSGNTISSYASRDGFNWVLIGNQTVSMVPNVYVGLVATSESTSALATATFDNVSINSGGAPAPAIGSVSATTGNIGSQVVITGSSFGASQGNSVVTLNANPATINSWSDTSISVTIPSAATSGLLAVSVASSMNDSNPVMFTVTSQPLPSGWLDGDEGAVGATGNASYAGGTFTVAGSGTLLSGTADAFHFVYQPLSGDGTIVARVGSMPTGGAEAGVMIRETLDAGSANGSITDYVPYGAAAQLFVRTTANAAASEIGAVNGTAPPYWVELTRSGSTLSGYASPDGVNWTLVGSQTINMASNVFVGLAVNSGAASATATAVFDNVTVSFGPPVVAPSIASLTPNVGAPGDSVAITGVNFDSTQGASSVAFNGVSATVTTWTATSIVAMVPGGATSGSVVVTVNGATSNGASFTVSQAPTIATLTPTAGPEGTPVTITGTQFGATQDVSTVTFNGTTATPTSWSATSIVVPVPAGATTGTVALTVGGVVSNGLSFTVTGSGGGSGPTVSLLSPQAGIVGSSLTISGSNFGTTQGGSTVTFNGTEATPTSWSSASIAITVPTGATTGAVLITVDGVASNGANFTVLSTPTITSLSPSSGLIGASVAITGSSLGTGQSSTVTFNGVAATPTSWADSSITVSVPSGATSGNVLVTVGGLSSGGIAFTVTGLTPSVSITSISPTSGIAGTQVTITGSNFGAAQAAGTVLLGTQLGQVVSWSGSQILANVVAGSASGTVQVQQGGLWSNSVNINIAAPNVTSVTPSSGVAGTQVTFAGSGFGTSQGSGQVWLGSASGTIVSWSDTQVVATVSANAQSGTAQITQGGVTSNSSSFNVNTASITSITPNNGVPGTQVTISGSGFGAVQGSGNAWLGSAYGTVVSWSDTQVAATVAVGSSSGTVQILQGGMLSNPLNFTVNIPHITGVSPAAGSPGTTVTISGTGFGATQGSGAVQLGSTPATVSTWSDTQIIAVVAASSQNGIAQATQNSVLSNTINFSVPSSGTTTTVLLTPNLLNMVVGDTHTLQALNSSGSTLQGLTWASSAITIASLSTDDPPIITALAPGHVTITAGDASADLTVYAGPTLPTGTIQWSSPGDGSGVSSIVPAVPSSTGVADVFAFEQSGNVQAIRSDGTVAWTANAGSPANAAVPDFQGGLTIQNLNSTPPTIQKLDGITGQPYPAYSYANPLHSLTGLTVVHTDGTIFTIDGDQLVGINPTTGEAVFMAPMEDSTEDSTPIIECLTCGYHDVYAPTVHSIIIAGDGYAYVAYSYSIDSLAEDLNSGNDVIHRELHLRVLRATSGGSYTKIPVSDWTEDTSDVGVTWSQNGVIPTEGPDSPQPLTVAPLITNADQGVLVSWSAETPAYCAYYAPGNPAGCVAATNQDMLTLITNGSAAPSVAQNLPGQISPVQPVLQAQDGSFIGVVSVGSTSLMVDFDSSFNVKWSVPGNYGPTIATADGSVIAQSGNTGPATTFDASGHVTGQMATLPTQSWLGNEYQVGSIRQVASMFTSLAPTFWALTGANASKSLTAAVPYEPPQAGLQTISSANLTAQSACSAFLDNLTAIAISNGRDPLGSNFTKAALLTEIQTTASAAINYVYDGPSSTTLWQQCTEPNCVAMFPVWFTGQQKPSGYLVKQEFEDNGPGTFHYIEGLSQYNGAAIWLRLDEWSGLWKGLTSSYITTISFTTFSQAKAGQVNSYGLGTLFHEVLHHRTVGGGFTHANMAHALGIESCSSGGEHNDCSTAIGTRCFPN
jgi:regulation of enolase protein 1 (concanavalin A-like superfamily)